MCTSPLSQAVNPEPTCRMLTCRVQIFCNSSISLQSIFQKILDEDSHKLIKKIKIYFINPTLGKLFYHSTFWWSDRLPRKRRQGAVRGSVPCSRATRQQRPGGAGTSPATNPHSVLWSVLDLNRRPSGSQAKSSTD